MPALWIPLRLHGRRFRAPLAPALRELRRDAEPWMGGALHSLLALRRGALVDVGANVGQTLLQLKSVDASRRYLGFEPNPVCAGFVSELIRINHFADAVLVPAALADRASVVELLAQSGRDMGASIVPALRPDRVAQHRYTAVALPFDQLYLHCAEQISVVKIDAEGAEAAVLRGMAQSLHKGRPQVICEVLHAHSPRQLEWCAAQNRELEQLLCELDYRIYRIAKSGPQPGGAERSQLRLQPLAKLDLQLWDRERSPALCDYVFAPAETRAALGAFTG